MKIFHEIGRGRKCKVPEVREAMFEWFINVQGVLKEPYSSKCFDQSASKYTMNG